MKIFHNKKILIIFTAIVLSLFLGKTVFAVWSGTFYNPGDTLNPECLPTDVDCDVLPPLTSLSGAVLTSQTTPQTIGLTGARLAKLWATDIATTDLTVINAIAGSVTGNAGTVTNGVYTTDAGTVFLAPTGDGSLLTNLPSPDLSGLVPYTGATGAVDLGAFSITANSFVKSGGTSSQFLKADGSIDSNTYLTSYTETDPVYLANTYATGMNQGVATTSVPQFAGVKTAYVYPSADSTTAFQIRKTDGTTSVLNVDTTNGRVGIGTASPSSPLHVYSGTANENFRVNHNGTLSVDAQNDANTQYVPLKLNASTYTFKSGIAGTVDALYLGSTGLVGIGTTTPVAKLDVAGSGRFTGSATSVLTGSIDPTASTTVTGVGTAFTTQLVVGDRITVTGVTKTVTAIASDTSLTVDSAFTDLANDTSPDKLAAIFVARDSSNVVKSVINDLGYVGIGTTSPSDTLHVSGSFRVSDSTYADSTGARLSGIISIRANSYVGYSSAILQGSYGKQLALGLYSGANSSNNSFVLTSSSYTTRDFDHADQSNPTFFVHDVTDPNITNNKWGSLNHNGAGFVITSGAETGSGSSPATIDNYLSFAPRGVEAVRITGNGNVGIGTTAPGELLSLGLAGTTKGVLSLAGNTSGKIIIQPAADAGTYTLTLPTDDGTASQFLQTDGSGVLSWATVSETDPVYSANTHATGMNQGVATNDNVLFNSIGIGTGATTPRGLFDVNQTINSTIADVTGADSTIHFNYFGGYAMYAYGYAYQYDVYAFKTVSGTKIFSATPFTISGTDDGSLNDMYLTGSWTTSSDPAVEGYRVIVSSDPYYGAAGDYYFDTTNTSFSIGDGGAGYDSVSTQYYTVGNTVTPSSISGGADFYIDTTTGTVYNKGVALGVNPFDQSLNTTDNVTFNTLSTTFQHITGSGAQTSYDLGASNDAYALAINTYVIPNVGWYYRGNGNGYIVGSSYGNFNIISNGLNSSGANASLSTFNNVMTFIPSTNAITLGYTGTKVGIGITPTSKLHLAAGSATAGTAPLGFTSGTLLTTPVVGKVEFLTDKWYGTITTGAARKTFAFLESPTFTGSVSIGSAVARSGTAGTNRLDIFDGTAPTGTLANGISLYSTSGELRVMDAAGNATLLSPHDLTTNFWVYDSVNEPRSTSLLIDMEEMMKKLNESFGWDYVHETINGVTTTHNSTTIDLQELNLNLESISGIITPVAGSANESFVTAFFDNVFAKIGGWMGYVGNGITKIFVGEVETKTLCISDDTGARTCLTKAQLDSLISGNPITPTTPPTPPNPDPDPNPDPEPTTTDPDPAPTCVTPQTLVDNICVDPEIIPDTTTPPAEPAPLLDQGGGGGGNSEPEPTPDPVVDIIPTPDPIPDVIPTPEPVPEIISAADPIPTS